MAKMGQTVTYLESKKCESVLRADKVTKRRLIDASSIRKE